MTIEDHKSLELAGLVRNISKNLEELVSKIQLKSNIYLDEIKNLKHEQLKAKEAYQELSEKIGQLEEGLKITHEAGLRLEGEFDDHLDANKSEVFDYGRVVNIKSKNYIIHANITEDTVYRVYVSDPDSQSGVDWQLTDNERFMYSKILLPLIKVLENKNNHVSDDGSMTKKVLTGSFPDKKVIGAYDRSSKTIYVEQKDEPQKQAFTIAHELGHFFLHKDKENDVFYRESLENMNNSNNLLEKEANCFAASLLMPSELVKKFWQLTKDVDAIAKLFGVCSFPKDRKGGYGSSSVG